MEWEDAVGAFERALQRLREVLAEPETTVVRDAASKRVLKNPFQALILATCSGYVFG